MPKLQNKSRTVIPSSPSLTIINSCNINMVIVVKYHRHKRHEVRLQGVVMVSKDKDSK